MPIHDWTRVPAGLFHHFHQDWSVEIARTLNRGRLPKGLSALVEQHAKAWEPDVLAIESRDKSKAGLEAGGLATLERPSTRIMRRSNKEIYAGRGNRVLVKHSLGRIVAIIEIISPGNKDSKAAIRQFVDKTLEFLRGGIHVLVVDLFPPTRRDPHGIHKLIWDEIEEEDFTFPAGKDRILATYQTGYERAAYVETIGVGEIMPDMALFLGSELNVKVPLELTYQATWEARPEEMRTAVETGVLPVEEESVRNNGMRWLLAGLIRWIRWRRNLRLWRKRLAASPKLAHCWREVKGEARIRPGYFEISGEISSLEELISNYREHITGQRWYSRLPEYVQKG